MVHIVVAVESWTRVKNIYFLGNCGELIVTFYPVLSGRKYLSSLSADSV